MGLAQEVRTIYNQQVQGTGLRMTRYPVINNAGSKLTASGNTTGAYKYAAAGANVIALAAAGAITTRFKIVGLAIDTPSAASIFVFKLGRGTASAAAFGAQLVEGGFEVATDAGGYVEMFWPAVATVAIDGVNDALVADLASSNAVADDTLLAAASVLTGLGT